MFKEYILSQNKTSITRKIDIKKNRNILNNLEKDKKIKNYELSGYKAYRDSIIKGENLAGRYPEYSRLYELYVCSIKVLDNEFSSKQKEIENGTQQESNEKYISHYQNEISKYEKLVESIKQDTIKFDFSDNSYQKHRYDEYAANIKEYERLYENAFATEQYYLKKIKNGETEKGLIELELINSSSQVLAAKNAKEIYRINKLAEYQEILSNLREKYQEIRIIEKGTMNKAELLADMRTNYEDTKAQHSLKTLSEIDGAITQKEEEIKQLDFAISERKILKEEYDRGVRQIENYIFYFGLIALIGLMLTLKMVPDVTSNDVNVRERCGKIIKYIYVIELTLAGIAVYADFKSYALCVFLAQIVWFVMAKKVDSR